MFMITFNKKYRFYGETLKIGTYIASESTFYRVLREEKMQHHRGRGQKPERRIPESHLATAQIKYGRGI
jgi:hypothetical protein